MSLEPGLQIELRIDKMSIGSGGVGRFEDQVVFVQRSAPGDLLRVEITESKKNFSRGRILSIVESGPSRVSPPCEYFEKCGGCSWQHMSYTEQISQKRQVVEEQLGRNLEVPLPKIQVWPSKETSRYRKRVRLKFQNNQFGYFGHRSHDFIAIEDCLIADEKIVEEAKLLRRKHEKPAELELALVGSSVVVRDLEKDEGEFTQANLSLNQKMIETVVAWASQTKVNNVYDLYCGNGNFSFPVSEKMTGAKVLGIEGNPNSIHSAQARSRERNFSPKRLQFLNSSVETALQLIPLESDSCVVIDPPRAGCSEFVIKTLGKVSPTSLIYISCHPASLARDLALFFESSPASYQLKEVHLFDMFPHTEHIETLVELRRTDRV